MISNKKVKRVEINDKVVYKYTDSSDNTIILDSNGNEVIKVSDSDYITLNTKRTDKKISFNILTDK